MKDNREPTLPKSGGKTPGKTSLKTPKSSLKKTKERLLEGSALEGDSSQKATPGNPGSQRVRNALKEKLPVAFHSEAHLRQLELVLPSCAAILDPPVLCSRLPPRSSCPRVGRSCAVPKSSQRASKPLASPSLQA